MNVKAKKIESSDEAWDERQLGADEAHVRVSDSSVDEIVSKAVDSKAISIRMRTQLIDDLKFIAGENEIGYQTLIKQVLQRFVECERRQKWNKLVSESKKEKKERAENGDKPGKKRNVA